MIVGIILGLFQLYSVIYPFIMKNNKVGNFILYLIVKICLFGKNLCYIDYFEELNYIENFSDDGKKINIFISRMCFK